MSEAKRIFKNQLYEQFARVGKALAHQHRIELIDLLAQAERSVEDLAFELGLPVANVSQHLQVLKMARMVEIRREGLRKFYRVADGSVFEIWRAIRTFGEEQLAEVDRIVNSFFSEREKLEPLSAEQLRQRIEDGDVVVLDVRPENEFKAGHIEGAISIPIRDLEATPEGAAAEAGNRSLLQRPLLRLRPRGRYGVDDTRIQGPASRDRPAGLEGAWSAGDCYEVNTMNSEKRSIDPKTLRRWLDEGREVTVLDIRKAADRAEWSIPGSVHFDAYDALKANEPAALANVTLPSGVPVVTVCGLGKTAQVAAEHLAARGIDAMALDGGMKAWSGAWNSAEIALRGRRTDHSAAPHRQRLPLLSYQLRRRGGGN